MSRSGFTLLEILVVVAISAVLSGFAIAYSTVSRNQVALTIEAAKIAQFILQAKQLSLATHAGSFAPGAPVFCGYGVVFNVSASPQTYSIFAYSPVLSPARCPAPPIATISAGEMRQYSGGTWQIPVSQGVILKSQQSNQLAVVLFYSPAPTVFLSSDGSTFPNPATTLNAYLVTTDGANSAVISVNPGGQVSF